MIASTPGLEVIEWLARDNREIVPVGFYDPDLQDTTDTTVKVRYARVGDVESRTAIFENEDTKKTYGTLMTPGKEREIPQYAISVVTNLVGPLQYPIGCPHFDKRLLATTEPTGSEWIKHGRAKLMAGVMKGSIPRNCTRRPFLKSKLGLPHVGVTPGEADSLVIVCSKTGGVKRYNVADTADRIYDFNSDDSDNPQADLEKSRFRVSAHMSQPKTQLIESPEEARTKDRTR